MFPSWCLLDPGTKWKTAKIKTEHKTVKIVVDSWELHHTVCIVCYWPNSELLGVSTIKTRHPGHVGLVHLRDDKYGGHNMRTGACGIEKHFVSLNTLEYAQVKCHIPTYKFVEIMSAHSPSTMITVPAPTVATRLVAKHSQPPWWSLLSGRSRREPLAITVYRERGVVPICEEGQQQVKIRHE